MASACAPKYVVQTAPEDVSQPVQLDGKTLISVSHDGSNIVWYKKPEEVVLILLHQLAAQGKADQDANAADKKRADAATAENEKCQANVKSLTQKVFDSAAAAKPAESLPSTPVPAKP